MAVDSYPLSWPAQWPREENPTYSNFKTGLVQARTRLMRELELLGATDVIISSNAQVNRYGEIAARQRRIDDTGVAVYFTLDGEQRCIPCDKWILLEDNVHAIELTVAALRGLERWGTHQVVTAAFQGFSTAVEPKEVVPSITDPWWIILGVSQSAPKSEISRAYREWARLHHPDVGGDSDLFREVTSAYQDALRGV